MRDSTNVTSHSLPMDSMPGALVRCIIGAYYAMDPEKSTRLRAYEMCLLLGTP